MSHKDLQERYTRMKANSDKRMKKVPRIVITHPPKGLDDRFRVFDLPKIKVK